MNIWYLLSISLGIQIILFIFAYWKQTDVFTDFSYALTFIVLSVLAITVTASSLILFGAIIAWAIRLGVYLVIRIRQKKSDKRFDAIRKSFFSYLGFWLGQGLLVWLIMLPHLFYAQSPNHAFSTFTIIGLSIWIIGFVLETVSDYQKFVFKSQHPKKLMTTKLFTHARHPNYLGEMLCWVGLYIYVLPTLSIAHSWIGMLSPLIIILSLRFVTGVPHLDKGWKKRYGKEYEAYKKKTNMFFPLPKP